jgi:hypothetical protein
MMSVRHSAFLPHPVRVTTAFLVARSVAYPVESRQSVAAGARRS